MPKDARIFGPQDFSPFLEKNYPNPDKSGITHLVTSNGGHPLHHHLRHSGRLSNSLFNRRTTKQTEQAKMDRYPSEKLVRKIVAIWYVGVKFFLFHLKSMNPIYNLHFKLFLYSHPFRRKMHTKLKIRNEFCLF